MTQTEHISMRRHRTLVICLLPLFCGCTLARPRPDRADMATVTTSGAGFVLRLPGAPPDGDPPSFIPWGFNYDRTVIDGRDVLLEEVLRDRPEKLDADFAAMRRLGGNVVRVFVATGEILAGPEEVNPAGLKRLDMLLATARKHDLRLLLVGLANIDPAVAPAWMGEADDEAMAGAEMLFWRTVTRHCRGHPAIFAYDLQNEPVIHWGDSEEWVRGCFDMSGGRKFCYVHMHERRISRRWTAHIHGRFPDEEALRRHWPDYPRPGESWEAIATPPFDKNDPRFGEYFAFQRPLLGQWAQRLAATIRAEDPGRLITVGALHPPAVAAEVDFHSFHLYPQSVPAGEDFLAVNARRWRERLDAIDDGKPIVIEEFYPLWLPSEVAPGDLVAALLEATGPRAAGWVSFYWGEPTTLNWPMPGLDRLYANWLEIWSAAGAGRHSTP